MKQWFLLKTATTTTTYTEDMQKETFKSGKIRKLEEREKHPKISLANEELHVLPKKIKNKSP